MRARSLPWLIGGLLSLACSSESKAPAGGTLADGTDAGTSSFDSGTPRRCLGPGYGAAREKVAFAHLTATVRDLDGNPVPSVPAQACGVNICLNGTTADDGTVTIAETADLDAPAFKYGGGRYYAKFALSLGIAGPLDVALGDQTTVAFASPESGAPLVAGTDATSNGVTLTPGKGASIDVDPIDYDTPELQKFRAAPIPVDRAPDAVDPSLGLGALFALAPAGATVCPAAKLVVPNAANYPAGAAVEFLVHGTEVSEEWAPYGGFAPVSSGTVSADGATIVTDSAGGLPILSVVGVRLRPMR